MFTHRPDCFGFLGVARELSGIQGQKFTSPDWYSLSPAIPDIESTQELALSVAVDAPDVVPRFMAVALSGVTIKQSPVWLQVELARVGSRPINNIVDYTNFFMLETSQPLHAYDYDKVRALAPGQPGASLGARFAREGETLKLLNGKTITLQTADVVITGGDQPIGLAGIMGGADTEVDDKTKNIIVEVANFDMYTIRRSSMHHGIFTDALTRFNKGQSPLQNRAVLAKMTNEVRRYADGKVASHVIDEQSDATIAKLKAETVHPPVQTNTAFINTRLGLQLSAEQMKTILENVECRVEVAGNDLTIQAPFWRTDIEIAEDVVEEVGRLYGYDNLPLDMPRRSLTPAPRNELLELKARLRAALAKAGANEVLTYSFVHSNLMQKVGQDSAKAFQISNALSPDLQYYRLSLTPSLLEKIHPNIKGGHGAFALFEIGKAHQVDATVKSDKPEEDGLPAEFERRALVFAADKKSAEQQSGAAYYTAKKYLITVLSNLGLAHRVTFEPLNDVADQATTYYAQDRAANVLCDGTLIGRIGEYTSTVTRNLKLPDYCAGFELGLAPLLKLASSYDYVPLPRFPKVSQDLCLKVPIATSYAEVYNFVRAELAKVQPDNSIPTLGPVDIYQRENDVNHKQITLRFSIANYDRTLSYFMNNHV
jgi:phenylalanyl-tRNA synthetase beta chain